MKIAFVLYGFFRTFEFCKSSMQHHILRVLNPDIFINTPSTIYTPPEHELPEFHGLYSRNVNSTSKVIDNFFNKSQLKVSHIREYDSGFYKRFIHDKEMPVENGIGQKTWRIASTLHSMSSSINSFKEYVEDNNEHYDLVILTRPDLRYYRDFDTSMLEMDKVNYPAAHMCAPDNPSLLRIHPNQRKEIGVRIRFGGAGIFGHPGQWFNDQIICGTQDNMLRFGEVFDQMETYFKDGEYINSETYLGVHCIRNSIPFIGTNFTTYEMWRIDRAEY